MLLALAQTISIYVKQVQRVPASPAGAQHLRGRLELMLFQQLGLSENVVYPEKPNGFADHYPYEKWLFHWGYTPFSDIPNWT